VCRICIVPGLGRDIGCRRMGNGSVRLVVAVVVVVVVVAVAAAAAAAAVKVDVDVGVAAAAAVKADVGVGVAEVVPGRLVAEAVPEAESLNTCPS
jgi:hypothetical protein